MTMDWSITNEGISNAYENVITWSRRRTGHNELAIIAAEWAAHERWNDDTNEPEFGPSYLADVERFKNLPSDALADYVWERAEHLRSCDNDFARVHLCPYGCECHKAGVDQTIATRRRLEDEA